MIFAVYFSDPQKFTICLLHYLFIHEKAHSQSMKSRSSPLLISQTQHMVVVKLENTSNWQNLLVPQFTPLQTDLIQVAQNKKSHINLLDI